MATLILVRHGRSTANSGRILAGRGPGIHLDDHGREQAIQVAERLAGVPLARVVSSPLERTRETAEPLLASLGAELVLEPGIVECDYGEWTGQSFEVLLKEPLWKTVQRQPSSVRFPDGESMLEMSSRGVAAVRRHDREVQETHGPGAVWVAFSHGDVIKSVLADAFGMHLDLFQRINVDPGSASVVRYGEHRPSVLAVNTHAGSLAWTVPPAEHQREAPAGDAVVGGGSGPTSG
ncbi:histidine phosphatase family protein [Nocardioides alcanivorans]|uniref:histidine phosphatase family protein n=1 Tax=Nocardioides alcanivorans TaxID=2897352 RepID=UPI001F353F79|nr:histidine phosphatase family protein [Nocardioides alcanivorans]